MENNMLKLFVSYELSLSLKLLGFDEPSFACYKRNGTMESNINPLTNRDIKNIRYTTTSKIFMLAPTHEQAVDWFRNKHGLYSAIVPKKHDIDNHVTGVEWYVEICGGDGVELGGNDVYSYNEAKVVLLRKLIELVK